MALLSKAAILEAVDLKTEDVEVPEWGGTVRVSVMTGTARDRFMELQAEGGEKKTPVSLFQARLLVSCVVDDSGALVFGPEDVEPLRQRSKAAIDRVVDVAMRLNKIGADAVEDEVKNSGAAQSGDSGSASASTSVSQ
ncbi:hypothetical protein [Cupriavidus sp. H18C2]|uniref:hypothetical protein n=1 Tax=Cupriavidus sp. H18C2 TaxID=3241602 RepID=UPI003BF85ABD